MAGGAPSDPAVVERAAFARVTPESMPIASETARSGIRNPTDVLMNMS
jgi:hypothetical protein